MLSDNEIRQLNQLYDTYNVLIDTGDEDAWVELFTADGFVQNGLGQFVGHARLREFLAARRQFLDASPYHEQQHWNANRSFLERGEAVRGICYFMRISRTRDTNTPTIVEQACYVDSVVHTDSGWRFASRTVHDSMVAAGASWASEPGQTANAA